MDSSNGFLSTTAAFSKTTLDVYLKVNGLTGTISTVSVEAYDCTSSITFPELKSEYIGT